jgi:hypothetical protein
MGRRGLVTGTWISRLDMMDRMGAEGSAGRPCWASALTIGARMGVKDSVNASSVESNEMEYS